MKRKGSGPSDRTDGRDFDRYDTPGTSTPRGRSLLTGKRRRTGHDEWKFWVELVMEEGNEVRNLSVTANESGGNPVKKVTRT